VRFRFDHAVVVVPSLAEGIGRYQAAGFAVRRGGQHDVLPTENALIAFVDGSYLELMAVRDPETRAALRALAAGDRWHNHLRGVSAIGRRFLPRLAGPDGVGDYALFGARLARFAIEARRHNLAMTGPTRFGRETPDGRRLEMELLLPAADFLPFFVEDHTPREWRVPADPEVTTHANGATGIAQVVVRVADVPAVALELAMLFDGTPRVDGEGRTRLGLAGVELVIVRGEPEGARGVVLAGVGRLPAEIEADGVGTTAGGVQD